MTSKQIYTFELKSLEKKKIIIKKQIVDAILVAGGIPLRRRVDNIIIVSRFPRLSHWLRHLFCTFVFVNGSCRYNIFFWLPKLILNTWIICVCCKSVELYKSSLWVDVSPNVRRPLRSSTCIYMFIDFTSISASIRV